MVHHQRHHHPQWGKNPEMGYAREEGTSPSASSPVSVCSKSAHLYKRSRPKFVFFFLLSLLCFGVILFSQLFSYSSSAFSLLYNFGAEDDGKVINIDASASSLCSSMSQGTICCDRSSIRSDICFMRGDVRTRSAASSILLYSSKGTNGFLNYVRKMGQEEEEEGVEVEIQHEKIKPYTRKWETSVMDTIDELSLVSLKGNVSNHYHCDVIHDVPALFFSTGGYTGNVYHEFNDGIIPLYITSQHMNKKVVFAMLEYHEWWISKYGDILSHLSDYPPVDFSGDKRTHCFPEAIVGLRIHDELTVDFSLMEGNKSINDFRNLLDKAYWPRVRGLIQEEEAKDQLSMAPTSSISPEAARVEDEEVVLRNPKLVILSRNGSRGVANENLIVELAEEIGFTVEILRPSPTTELAKVYRVLNSSDVMMGVHGAAMTHFLFLKPGSVFIQVIPLGTQWAAETYYGEPARKLGLKYIDYEILPRESSLYDKYDKRDPILTDPESVTKKGWEFTKKIYLDDQNVTLDLRRFKKRLLGAYKYSITKRRRHHQPSE